MKKTLFITPFLISMILWGTTLKAQVNDPCVRNISTNPYNAYNDEWSSMYPNDPGSFINDASTGGFNWYFGNVITIDKGTQGWSLPSGFPSNYPMLWPFELSNGNHTRYLYEPGGEWIPEGERDFHWEDGWELLWMNIGTLPNGTAINAKPQSSWNDDPESPLPAGTPYFVLYNRYRGTLRLFFNVWFFDTHYDDVLVSLRFEDGAANKENLSGIFRHVEGVDRALDKPTNVTKLQSPRKMEQVNYNQWYALDFQLGYDVCQCEIPSKLILEFKALNELSVDLELRSITLEKELTKLNEDEKDFLQWTPGTSGNVIYKSINGLLEDYNKALDQYNQDMNDYNSPLNSLKKDAINLLGTGLSGWTTSLIPTGALADFIMWQQRGLWGSNDPADTANTNYPVDSIEAKEWGISVKNASKKLLADQFDFLNIALDVKEQPVRPQVPVASFTEGRITGSIRDTFKIRSSPLLVPGTMPTAYGGVPSDIRSTNFPAYNNVPGLFALLETPSLQITDKNPILQEKEIVGPPAPRGESKSPEPGDDQGGDPSNILSLPTVTQIKETSLMLKEGLSYTLNPALDWDMKKTRIGFAFQLEYDLGFYSSDLDLYDIDTYISDGNFELTHRISENGKLKAIITSTYYDADLAKQVLFKSALNNEIVDWNGQGGFLGEENVFSHVKPTLTKIRLKVVADMYFDQLGYDGDKVSTFQVFTYDLFDALNDDLLTAISREDGDLLYNDTWTLYTPGVVKVNGTIGPNHPLISLVDGNNLYVRAENLIVDGATGPAPGYNLFLEGLSQVKIIPHSGRVLPGTQMRIRDFYGEGKNPITVTDAAFRATYCDTKYKANNISSKAKLWMEREKAEEIKRSQNQPLRFKVHPNPARDNLTVNLEVYTKENDQILFTLCDLAGRQVLRIKTTVSPDNKYFLKLPSLSSGLYILRVESDSRQGTEKVLIQP